MTDPALHPAEGGGRDQLRDIDDDVTVELRTRDVARFLAGDRDLELLERIEDALRRAWAAKRASRAR